MKTRGYVSLVFDDGYTSIYENIVPLLDRYTFPGVFAVPLRAQAVADSEKRPVTAWESWLKLQERGHEIAAHSISHVNLTKLTDDELVKELREPAEQLGATTLIYPGGAHDARVIEQVRQFYKAARTVKKGFNKRPVNEPLELVTYNFTKDNFSVWKANALAWWAYINNLWLIETYHVVGDADATVVHNVPMAEFKKHLWFLSQLPVKVATIKDLV